ncbi:uncharacterized protein LOC115228560 [Octopus sinensis]|uniref:Uncharacterized protein LOC115228560 n=1 Tax=Octopus sinensis TaxID=2607531 RepID=A0A6P7U0C3_9MOLL|nr:uncharacterized protein LOC115228560 [Octopus sinensis]
MLNGSYLRRHNEVIKRPHLRRQYQIKKLTKLKTHPAQSVITNEFVEIRFDTNLPMDTANLNNKPDIFIHDKSSNTITLIEVGITSQNCLKQVDVKKFYKYDLLVNELEAIYKTKMKIVPIVMTWDGIVSKFSKNYLEVLGVEDRLKAYSQTLVSQKT